jgi:proline dehydrogenase
MSLFDRAVVGLLPLVPKPVVRRFSRPYIAGVRLPDAIAAIRQLNGTGMRGTLDVLGEHIHRMEDAAGPLNAYLEVLSELHRTGVDSNISVKLTQLGLTVDREACFRNIHALVVRARELGNWVRIDMEDSSCTEPTLEIYGRLRGELDNVGIVLQAMLRRSLSDAEALARLTPNVRLCKGIYVEPRRIAYQDGELINRNFLRILERLVGNGSYVGIATHDERLVYESLRLIEQHGLSRDRYEFQMLLGVEPELRQIIVDAGHPMRVYVPFGEQWYAYSMRRMRENPKIAGHVARTVLGLSNSRPSR